MNRTERKTPRRVLLLAPTCVAIDGDCEASHANAVAARMVADLQFSGRTVIDARKVVADARSRRESGGALKVLGVDFLSASGRELNGSLFDDLSPDRKAELMKALNVDGVLNVGLQVHPMAGLENRYVVQLQMKDGDDQLVWVSRCQVVNYRAVIAVDEATTCALQGIKETPRRQGGRTAL